MLKINLGKIRLSMDIPPPPPPPSTSPKSRKKLFAILAVILIAIILIPSVLVFSGALNFDKNNPQATPTPGPSATNPPVTTTPTSQTNHNVINIASGAKTPVASQSIDSAGGTIQVTDASSLLNGLKIVVPEAATSEPIQFQVSYSDISDVSGLPQNTAVASKLISIETSGSDSFNKYKMFEEPVRVTLPYNANEQNDDNNSVRFYWYDSQTNALDSAGFLSEDKTAHTITFLTGSFSDFVAVRTMLNITGSMLGIDATVDTGFRPARDGWFIPNHGSYLWNTTTNASTTNGFCLGMVSYAKWYYSDIATGLHSKYLQGNLTEWRDDATAIQLAARAHLATSGIWAALTQEETDWATANAREVALSWISGMIVTGEPQLIGLKTVLNNGTWLPGGHAIMTYAYHDGVFEIYDPNYPASLPGNTMREIPFTYSMGFNQTYISGLTRNDAMAFNIFYHAGSKLSATPSDYRGLYDSAEKGFKDNNLFPTVTLTDTTTNPTGTTPTDTDKDGVRDTTDSKVTISGTITGGVSQINSTLLWVDNQKYTAAVVNGVFSKEVPLMPGDNDVVVLATADDTFNNWAGFIGY